MKYRLTWDRVGADLILSFAGSLVDGTMSMLYGEADERFFVSRTNGWRIHLWDRHGPFVKIPPDQQLFGLSFDGEPTFSDEELLRLCVANAISEGQLAGALRDNGFDDVADLIVSSTQNSAPEMCSELAEHVSSLNYSLQVLRSELDRALGRVHDEVTA